MFILDAHLSHQNYVIIRNLGLALCHLTPSTSTSNRLYVYSFHNLYISKCSYYDQLTIVFVYTNSIELHELSMYPPFLHTNYSSLNHSRRYIRMLMHR